MRIVKPLQRALLKCGIELRRYVPPGIGSDAFRDMHALCESERPVIFDVGANTGQTTLNFLKVFGAPSIHAFEPGLAFAELSAKASGIRSVSLNNFALAAVDRSTAALKDNEYSDMSSILPSGSANWGGVETERVVDVRTIDSYAAESGIDRIDVLKSDTQGYDLEVLKGATRMLERAAIRMIYVEIILADLYVGQPTLAEISSFVTGYGFNLVSFYNFAYRNDRLGWMDALFLRR